MTDTEKLDPEALALAQSLHDKVLAPDHGFNSERKTGRG